MSPTLRIAASLVIGCVVVIALARLGVVLARLSWPDNVIAERHKTYTLAMLIARLAVGALSVAAAACATTFVARDQGRAAWWLGTIFLLISLPNHLYFVWRGYPCRYHAVYLAYLVPIAGLSGRVVRRQIDAQLKPPPARPSAIRPNGASARSGDTPARGRYRRR